MIAVWNSYSNPCWLPTAFRVQ